MGLTDNNSSASATGQENTRKMKNKGEGSVPLQVSLKSELKNLKKKGEQHPLLQLRPKRKKTAKAENPPSLRTRDKKEKLKSTSNRKSTSTHSLATRLYQENQNGNSTSTATQKMLRRKRRLKDTKMAKPKHQSPKQTPTSQKSTAKHLDEKKAPVQLKNKREKKQLL